MPTSRRGQPFHTATVAGWLALGAAGQLATMPFWSSIRRGQDFAVYCTKMWPCKEVRLLLQSWGLLADPWFVGAGGPAGGPCSPPWSPGIASARQGNVEPLGPCRGVQGPVMLFGPVVPRFASLHGQQIGRCKPQNPQNPTFFVLQVVAQATSNCFQENDQPEPQGS